MFKNENLDIIRLGTGSIAYVLDDVARMLQDQNVTRWNGGVEWPGWAGWAVWAMWAMWAV